MSTAVACLPGEPYVGLTLSDPSPSRARDLTPVAVYLGKCLRLSEISSS